MHCDPETHFASSQEPSVTDTFEWRPEARLPFPANLTVAHTPAPIGTLIRPGDHRLGQISGIRSRASAMAMLQHQRRNPLRSMKLTLKGCLPNPELLLLPLCQPCQPSLWAAQEQSRFVALRQRSWLCEAIP